MTTWVDKNTQPPVQPSDFEGYFRSVDYLGYFGNGHMAVVYYEQWDDDPGKWITGCSEGWNVNDCLMMYTKLPEAPDVDK